MEELSGIYKMRHSVSFLSLQERILRAVSGKGTADGQGLRVQEIPQEGWQKSAKGCQERDHDLENVCGDWKHQQMM